jgi:excisionase family DNA binding protein
MDITFENLPKAVSKIHNELVLLKELISQNKLEPIVAEREFINVTEAAKILRLHPTTVSQKLKNGLLPGQKKGKLWYIYRNQLMAYLRQSDNMSLEDFAIDADDFLKKKKR